MKQCRKCKHYREAKLHIPIYADSTLPRLPPYGRHGCTIYSTQSTPDPIDGSTTTEGIKGCVGMRRDGGECGPQGKLYSPVSIWRRLFT